MKKLKLLKFHWAKLLSIFFFALLLGAYANIFAIASPYSPGEILDPLCAPGQENCIVAISSGTTPSGPNGGIQFNDNGVFGSSSGFTWVGGTGDPFSVGPDITFTKADYEVSSTPPPVDNISTFVHIARDSARGIYNKVTEPHFDNDNYTSPAGTEWNAGGWSNLSDIESRPYETWMNAIGRGGDNVLQTELIMHDIGDDKYYKIQFTSWSVGETGGTGGFSYIRTLINPDFSLGTVVNFTRPDSVAPYDDISPSVHLSRNETKGLFNAVNESFYDWNDNLAPTGTEWNSIGWGDLTDVDTRTYTTFSDALDGSVGDNILGAELVMHDILADKYYKFDFTSWTSADNGTGGGGYSYTRNLITLANGTTNQLTVSGNILMEGLNRYLNFNTDSGKEGYGIRDNGGVIEYKNLAGDWAGIGGGGLSSDADFNTKGGTDAGLNLVVGAQYNTFLGYEAGKSGSGASTSDADNNTAIGYQSLYSNTTGFNNTANGSYSLFSNTTGLYNTANGYSSLYSNTTGVANTANGNSSLYSNTTGYFNTANGNQSLYSNTTGERNTANGNISLYFNTTGSNNTANGDSSLFANTTGSNNTANGFASLEYNTTGYFNTANGSSSLYSNTTGSQNTANGYQSLYSNTTGENNTANGSYSLSSNTTGGGNTANGMQALYSNTTGSYNTANGMNSLYFNTSGTENTANGNNSLYSNTTGFYNTANGNESLYFNTTGNNNTANGAYSLYSNTTGNQNTANGNQSLFFNTTGSRNTANGMYSLQYNTTGGSNIANGFQSLRSNTTGYSNTANGVESLYSNTTGSSNTANGMQALYSNTTSNYNTANGAQSLRSNTTGDYNTANGVQSLYSNTTGSSNAANGMNSLFSNTTGSSNATNGMQALYSNTTGNYNTANGNNSLYYNTTGSSNTANGYGSGRYMADGLTANTTSNNSLYLGYDTRALADGDTNEIVIGYNAIGHGSDTTTIGNDSTLRTYLTGLNLKAGSATAGTAPLKFTSGTNLGTTEAGAVEYDGTHLYFTAVNAGTRYQLDQQSGGGGLISDADFNTKGGTNAGLNLIAGGQQNSTFIGYNSGYLSSTGINNTAIGANSLSNNISGDNNTATGTYSLANNVGYFNTATGAHSLSYNTTGNQNTANGQASLGFNTTGGVNTAIGDNSLRNNTTGSSNTASGANSLFTNSSGNNNTTDGRNSLSLSIDGSDNTVVGYQAGRFIFNGTTANTTGDYNVFLGSDTKPLADNDQNEIVIGYNTTGKGSNTTTIGTGNVLYVGGGSVTGMVARFTNGTGSCDINPTTASIGCSSDIRLKKNITTLDGQDFILNTEIKNTKIDEETLEETNKTVLEKLISLNPVKYNWNIEDYQVDENGNDNKHIGFIAQEMEQIFPDLVATDKNTGLKSIFYTNLIPYTIEAIQEMNLKVTDLSSLDTENATSLGSLIKDFLGNVGNNISDLYASVIHSDKVETKILCVGSTCVTEDQFLEIVNKNITTGDAAKENKDDGPAIIPVTPPLDAVEAPVEDKKEEEQPVIEKKTEETPAETPAPLVDSTSENTD